MIKKKTSKKFDTRNVRYVYDYIDHDGHRHAGINVYDTVLKWITFVNDFKFTSDEVKSW